MAFSHCTTSHDGRTRLISQRLSSSCNTLSAGNIFSSVTQLLVANNPFDLYDAPRSAFVAQFLGDANILKGVYDDVRGICMVEALTLHPDAAHRLPAGHVTIAVKPEAIHLSRGLTDSGVDAKIVAREFQGFMTHFLVHAQGIPLRVTSLTSNETHGMTVGQTVTADLDWARCSVFPGW